MTNSNLRGPFYIGEKRWLKFNFSDELDGVQIASVVFTPESPVTEVGGSSTIYTRNMTNDSVKARFDFSSAVADTRYSITATVTAADGEVLKGTIVAVVRALPV